MKKFLLFPIVFSLFISAFSPFLWASAQTTTCPNDVRSREPARCAELDALVKEEMEAQKEVDRLKGLGAGFASDIAFLTQKIAAAQANIKAKNNQISLLTKDIAVKQSQIVALDGRIDKGKRAIAEILRKTNEIGSYSLIETLLSDKALSEFFVDFDTYASTEEALDNLFEELRDAKALTQAQKAELSKRKEAEAAAKATLEAAKKQVEIANNEKKTLLAINEANKKTYEQVVADRRAKADKIRANLFALTDTDNPIDFGTALAYAEAAEQQTGVRAAFILGIFATESGKGSDGTFGRNTGRCFLVNASTGEGKGASTGNPMIRIMNPTRDVPPFLEITKDLGRDPYGTRVSCWQAYYDRYGNPIGWGGAMGPAQFIPSTWKLMIPKLKTALSKSVPNPWLPQDAFMAAAFYLSDLGASGSNYANERKAAHRYNGTAAPCRTPTSRYSYQNDYCNKVMANATRLQADIDFLRGK